jgi:GNAT superfamily N-acetyltransferase
LLTVRRANPEDAPIVALFVDRLLAELTGTSSKLEGRAATAVRLLAKEDCIFGFLAYEAAEPVGVMMVSESHSIYAGGAFGVITELYVASDHRSAGVAPRLIAAGATLGRLRGWPQLEVGAPISLRGPAACNSTVATASLRSARGSGCWSNKMWRGIGGPC